MSNREKAERLAGPHSWVCRLLLPGCIEEARIKTVLAIEAALLEAEKAGITRRDNAWQCALGIRAAAGASARDCVELFRAGVKDEAFKEAHAAGLAQGRGEGQDEVAHYRSATGLAEGEGGFTPCGCPVLDCQHHRGLASRQTWKQRAEEQAAEIERLKHGASEQGKAIDHLIAERGEQAKRADVAEAKVNELAERPGYWGRVEVAEAAIAQARREGIEAAAKVVDGYVVSFSHNYQDESKSLAIAAQGIRALLVPEKNNE